MGIPACLRRAGLTIAAAASAAVLAVGCTADAPTTGAAGPGSPTATDATPGSPTATEAAPGSTTQTDSASGSATPTGTPPRTIDSPRPTDPGEPTATPGPTAPAEPTDPATPTGPRWFRAAAALRDVRTLAGRIGPRLATGRAFRRAADLVQDRFTKLGYTVRRQRFGVPAGDSWGVPVRAGHSLNVVATPPGFNGTRPHLVLGAHLDTVAVSPGAEDNASGVAVLLEVARLVAARPPRLPVVVVAFGAEEPRGPGDALHHFGSRHYVRQLGPRRLAAIRGMVSLDRVGVGTVVPVCTGPLSPPRVQDALLRVARREAIPAAPCDNTASDHWSFEKAGVPVARLGSTSYAAYHSARDVPSVVDRRQLGRTGRLVWQWLRGR